MRVAFIYGLRCLVARRFNFSDVWGDPQGLTGSELSFLKVAKGMADRGHEVRIFTQKSGSPDVWEGIPVHDYEERGSHEVDAALSWNESEPLRQVSPLSVKAVSWQLNKFDHCTPDSDDFVDFWMSPSECHRTKMLSGLSIGSVYGFEDQTYRPDPSLWKVVPHGCEPDRYRSLGVEKVPGRVIWASSPDRGLHWLLQEWPKIRRSVPNATLRIFYGLDSWFRYMSEPGALMSGHPDLIEQVRRAAYVKEAVRRLSGHGLEVVSSVSRNQIDREMAEAEVLAYCCDPVTWTEGFSVTLLEACAARACPVTTAVDALPSVYGGVVPMADAPVRDHVGEFSDLVIRALTDPAYRGEVNDRAEALARRHSWDAVIDKIEELIKSKLRTEV